MKLGVAILAAGQGTRMCSALPKVLHPLAGRPLLAHVIDKARSLAPHCLAVVHGYGGEQVRAVLADPAIRWVAQAEQLGTAHALLQAMPALEGVDRVLVLYGDVPLIGEDTLATLIRAAHASALALLTVRLDDPTGYGRIMREGAGRILRIVEHGDATPAEREIREVNTGILVADRARLSAWLSRVGNDNAQREYYLTDIIGLAVADGVEVPAVHPREPSEVEGVNDRVQLARLERRLQRSQADALMRAGVTLSDPARFDLRGSLAAGRDVSIDIDVIIEGDVELGDGVRLGAHSVVRNSRIGAGTWVLEKLGHRGQHRRCAMPHRALCPAAPRNSDRRRGAYRQLRRDQEFVGRAGLQDQPPELRRGRQRRSRCQHWRRHHHLQLRRRQ